MSETRCPAHGGKRWPCCDQPAAAAPGERYAYDCALRHVAELEREVRTLAEALRRITFMTPEVAAIQAPRLAEFVLAQVAPPGEPAPEVPRG